MYHNSAGKSAWAVPSESLPPADITAQTVIDYAGLIVCHPMMPTWDDITQSHSFDGLTRTNSSTHIYQVTHSIRRSVAQDLSGAAPLLASSLASPLIAL